MPGDFWPENLGIAGLYLLVVLAAITVFRFQSYQPWFSTHKLTGLGFLLGGIRALGEDSAQRTPLLRWLERKISVRP